MPRLLACSLVILAACGPAVTPAGLILQNATIYTVDDERPTAEAVAIQGDRIVFVGSNAEVARYRGAQTRVEDLGGATVVPGLTDAHYHLAGVGEREITLNLEGTNSKEAFLAKVAERVARAKPGEWIVGRGWIETFWTPQAFPSRADLDPISPNNPVLLTRADGHASVVNTKALEAAGITRSTAAPSGGALNKDARGEITGMLIDRAQGLVARHLPADTPEQLDSMVVIGARVSTELGWTQVQDAGTSWSEVARMRRLYGAERLKLRVYQAIRGPGESADSLLANGPILGEFGGRYTVRTI
jgi:hypothetical protein